MKSLFLLTFVLISISCAGLVDYPVPIRFKSSLNCYDSVYTGIDTLINIQGYYSSAYFRDNKGVYGYVNGKYQELNPDTVFNNIIFFADGIFVDDISFRGLTVEQGLRKMSKEDKTFRYRAYYHGTYEVKKDTIIVQYISPGYGNVWFAREEGYKIIHNSKIQLCYTKHLALQKYEMKQELYQSKYYDNAPYSNFIYVDSIPKSDSWLKKEEWFWCK